MTRVLVCGGRDYSDKDRVFDVLDTYNDAAGIDLIIEGGARGADRHVIARELLGPMADDDENLRPAHVDCHKAKTKHDRADIAKSNHVRAKWNGAHRPKQRMGNGNNQHTATRHLTKGVGPAYFEEQPK